MFIGIHVTRHQLSEDLIIGGMLCSSYTRIELEGGRMRLSCSIGSIGRAFSVVSVSSSRALPAALDSLFRASLALRLARSSPITLEMRSAARETC